MSGFERRPTGLARRSTAVKQAWKLTNEDMTAIAEQRREEGWEVVATPAIHTSPVSRDDGDDDRFGLVHVIPDNHAERFSAAYEAGEYTEYLVYQRQVNGTVFLVTELMDPDIDQVILVASNYDRRLAAGMIRSVLAEEVIYTYAKTIGGRDLGSFRHEEYDPFLPTSDDEDAEET